MSSRAASSFVVLVSSLLSFGCPSKENQSSSGATSPSSAPGVGGSSITSSVEGSSSGAPDAAGGPLAMLETASFVDEVWTSQEGEKMPFIYYAQPNVRLSAQCRHSNGQLACDALHQLRSEPPVEIPRRSLTGGVSAGTRVCMKLKHQLVTGRNAAGTEDGFCRFPDGSMVSTGALEQYAMRVVE